jgi:uncharacterized phage protein (TIGR01671 family)
MNREIKFRAWDGESMSKNCATIQEIANKKCMSRDSNKLVWMQFTGLTDKNGKEIYEGDIVTIDKIASLYKKCPITIIGVIVFNFGKYEVQTKKVINKNFTDKTSIHFGLVVMDWIHLPEFNKTEVIGNIFENPELIK